eukprot:TRINITY_DN23100_c0_g1_i1.p2 TRINITY_DN23100_c0_g1~~TRINITY_DN23100_c0_g1_i1.p2  ORF type:complete len:235 (+),score=42.04 TRINITY_DN23100_c0_g1_i1:146-850(+)
MAGSFADRFSGAAADVALKSASNSASQGIGRPLEGLSSPGSARSSGHAEINWVNFNYPPLLRIIHFDIEELPVSLTGIVRRLKISFQLTVFACCLNVFDTLIVVFSTRAPKRWLLQSGLHLVMLPAAALAVFYSGYRGLAEPDTSLLFRYKVGQPVLGFCYALLGIVPWGCANGLVQLAEMKQHTEGSVFWTVVIIFESTCWLVNVLFTVLNLYRAHHLDQLSSGAGSVAGNRF